MPSGRFLLRIDPGMHELLRRAARAARLSLNDYCARRLAAPAGGPTGVVGVDEAVRRAAALVGGALVGVIAFGSWARGEERDGSDLDLLVVVDDELEITRALYRRWDESEGLPTGRRIEVHFAHLPTAGRPASGLWAEVAVDGVVLFARDLELGRRLAAMRRAIVEGSAVRKRVHGQPYWVEGQ